MSQAALYNAFFKSQDRFLQPDSHLGFEPDIIGDYIHNSMNLASWYEADSQNENMLLAEWTLKQVYFNLLDAIQDPKRSRIFRRVCLDSIHTPLIALKRHFSRIEDGDIEFLRLKQNLRFIHSPYD